VPSEQCVLVRKFWFFVAVEAPAYLGWHPDEGEVRCVLGREDVPVQRSDAVVVDGEPVQVEEREVVAIPEGQCHSLPVRHAE
jgi:hypothetical protein